MSCFVVSRDGDKFIEYGIFRSFELVIDVIKKEDPDNDFDFEFLDDEEMFSIGDWSIEIKKFYNDKNDFDQYKNLSQEDLYNKWEKFINKDIEEGHSIEQVAPGWDNSNN